MALFITYILIIRCGIALRMAICSWISDPWSPRSLDTVATAALLSTTLKHRLGIIVDWYDSAVARQQYLFALCLPQQVLFVIVRGILQQGIIPQTEL